MRMYVCVDAGVYDYARCFFSSSANAYMLMYRQVGNDNESKEMFTFPIFVPIPKFISHLNPVLMHKCVSLTDLCCHSRFKYTYKFQLPFCRLS